MGTTVSTSTGTRTAINYPDKGTLTENFSTINSIGNRKQIQDYSTKVEYDWSSGWCSEPWWIMEQTFLTTTGMKPKYRYYKGFNPNDIVDVRFYPPVVKMKFKDGTETEAKAQSGDEFDKETGMMICIMQYIFQDKTYNNMFRKWIKKDQDREREKAKARVKKKEDEKVKARKLAKNQERKEKRKAKAKEEAIEIQKEAYLSAMKEYSGSSKDKKKGSSSIKGKFKDKEEDFIGTE